MQTDLTMQANPSLPYSPACERNREPILQALLSYLIVDEALPQRLERNRSVLEISSGTGQHAAYFTQFFSQAVNFPLLQSLRWQPSDVHEQLTDINLWREKANNANFLTPIELDLRSAQWEPDRYDFAYTANSLHIFSWPLVLEFCRGVVITLRPGGLLFIYGPFTYDGEFTSDSNESFDSNLRDRDERSGLRDFTALTEALCSAASLRGATMEFQADISMPANNQLLVFKKASTKSAY